MSQQTKADTMGGMNLHQWRHGGARGTWNGASLGSNSCMHFGSLNEALTYWANLSMSSTGTVDSSAQHSGTSHFLAFHHTHLAGWDTGGSGDTSLLSSSVISDDPCKKEAMSAWSCGGSPKSESVPSDPVLLEGILADRPAVGWLQKLASHCLFPFSCHQVHHCPFISTQGRNRLSSYTTFPSLLLELPWSIRLYNVLRTLWLSFCLLNLPIPIETVCSGANGNLQGRLVFGCRACPSPLVDDEGGWMISPSKWWVLLVENQAACVTCRPPSRVLIVVPCQSPGVPTGWWVCLPQGPIEHILPAALVDSLFRLLLPFVCSM